jgi:hypothetical protein
MSLSIQPMQWGVLNLVYLSHDPVGLSQSDNDSLPMVEVVGAEFAAFAVFQPFLRGLIADSSLQFGTSTQTTQAPESVDTRRAPMTSFECLSRASRGHSPKRRRRALSRGGGEIKNSARRFLRHNKKRGSFERPAAEPLPFSRIWTNFWSRLFDGTVRTMPLPSGGGFQAPPITVPGQQPSEPTRPSGPSGAPWADKRHFGIQNFKKEGRMKRRLLAALPAILGVAPFAVPAVADDATKMQPFSLSQNCDEWTSGVGSFCTVIESNVAALKKGTKILYYGSTTKLRFRQTTSCSTTARATLQLAIASWTTTPLRACAPSMAEMGRSSVSPLSLR